MDWCSGRGGVLFLLLLLHLREVTLEEKEVEEVVEELEEELEEEEGQKLPPGEGPHTPPCQATVPWTSQSTRPRSAGSGGASRNGLEPQTYALQNFTIYAF